MLKLKSKFLENFPAAIALLFAIILTVESFLSISQKSLCFSQACKTVGSYLSIAESLLVAFGASFFWILLLSFILTKRYPEKFKNLTYILLIVAISADSALIGFQVFSIQQYCLLCFCVALALIISSIIYSYYKRSPFFIFCFLFIFLGGFSVQSILKYPPPKDVYINLSFLEINRQQDFKNDFPRCTLIFSLNCQHCQEIFEFLSERKMSQVKVFRLASIDQDLSSLRKISFFLDKYTISENIFKLILTTKQSGIEENYPIRKQLKKQSEFANFFLSSIGINNIPLLVVEHSEFQRSIIIGSGNIIESLIENRIVFEKSNRDT